MFMRCMVLTMQDVGFVVNCVFPSGNWKKCTYCIFPLENRKKNSYCAFPLGNWQKCSYTMWKVHFCKKQNKTKQTKKKPNKQTNKQINKKTNTKNKKQTKQKQKQRQKQKQNKNTQEKPKKQKTKQKTKTKTKQKQNKTLKIAKNIRFFPSGADIIWPDAAKCTFSRPALVSDSQTLQTNESILYEDNKLIHIWSTLNSISKQYRNTLTISYLLLSFSLNGFHISYKSGNLRVIWKFLFAVFNISSGISPPIRDFY